MDWLGTPGVNTIFVFTRRSSHYKFRNSILISTEKFLGVLSICLKAPIQINDTYFLELSCLHRNVSRNVIQTPFKHSWNVGDVVMYSCQEGFVLNGPINTTCGMDGKWTKDVPVCSSK